MSEARPAPLIGLAPMAGVTDLPMRALSYRMGAMYACTEMVSAVGWMCAKKDHPVYRLLTQTAPEEYDTAIQLFGKDPVVLAEATVRACELRRFTAIDINMGCPARKVTASGEGSALLKTPELACRIMETVKTHSALPVTVKTRLGYDAASMNALELARAAETFGLKWICIHGRTRAQMYAGQSDYAAIAAIAGAVRIPVIANGDVFTAGEAVRALAETGCAGVLIGRGAMGNPWIFQKAQALLAGQPEPEITPQERRATALEHIDLMVAHKGERLAVREMRTHIGHYIAGVRGASVVRRALNTAKTTQEQKELLRLLFLSAEQEGSH